MLKLLIADDHLLFMEGLTLVLRGRFPGCLIYQASHLLQVQQQLRDHSPFDLLLLDRTMPGVDSLQHLQTFWSIIPTLRIAVISATDSAHYVQEALSLGIVGFISKASAPDAMVEAIQHILRGGIYIQELPSSGQGSKIPPQTLLPPRLLEVLTLAANGYSNKQIAASLIITEGTVKQHFHIILKTLDAYNRTQAIQKARLLGLVS